MANSLYNQVYLDGLMLTLDENVDGLSQWDAYNQDILNTEIVDLRNALTTLRKHITINYTTEHSLHSPDIIVGCQECFPQGEMEERNDDSAKEEMNLDGR